jgi:hypothetical protein
MLVEYLEVSARQYEDLVKKAPNDYVRGIYEGKALTYKEILCFVRNIIDFVVEADSDE